MPSFDIVSRTNLAEVDNALQGVKREIRERYDFKDSKSSIERLEQEITLIADDDYKLRQIQELLAKYLVRRSVDPATLDFKTAQPASGGTIKQVVGIKQGIPQEMAKRIVKDIKDSGLKVQASIQGDDVRVSGKKRDDLQAVIARIRQMNIGQPLQYVNFRD